MKKLVLVLLLAVSGNALGAFVNGNRLLGDCEGEANHIGTSYCLGYISSAADTYRLLVSSYDINKQMCLLDGVTQGQLMKIVVKYLEENPAVLHHDASSLVVTALRKAFPCK